MRFGDVSNDKLISKYLKWKGAIDDGFFAYWDKEQEEEIQFDLGEFIVLKIGYTIKGFIKKGKGKDIEYISYFSNEIEHLRKEELEVKTFDGSAKSIKGIYKNIKGELPQGVRLHLAVTVLKDGEIIEFFLKGQTFFDFSELLKKTNFKKYKITVDKIEKVTEGTIHYSTISFKEGSEITTEEFRQAIEADKKLREYEQKNKIDKLEDEEITVEDVEEELGGEAYTLCREDVPF